MSFATGLKTIVVATDLEGRSEAALEYARKIAGAYGARIVLAHGLDPVEYAAVDAVPGQVRHGLTEQARAALDAFFVEIQQAVHFNLERVDALFAAPVEMRGVASGIRNVARGGEAASFKRMLRMAHESRRGRGAVTIAQDDIVYVRRRGHRMAIHHDRHTEPRARFRDQTGQRRVVGMMQMCQPLFGILGPQLLAINFGAVAYDTRDDAQPRRHACAMWVDVETQRSIEHGVIQFGGCPIGIDIGARKQGCD